MDDYLMPPPDEAPDGPQYYLEPQDEVPDGPQYNLEPPTRSIPEGPNATFDVPVVFPVFGEGRTHNTAQAHLSLHNSREYYHDLVDEILQASNDILDVAFKDDQQGAKEALSRLERSMIASSCVYFVWEFAPPIQFTETSYTMPAYGTSEAYYLLPTQLSDHFQAAVRREISYIFVAVDITRDVMPGPGLRELTPLPPAPPPLERNEEEEEKRIRRAWLQIPNIINIIVEDVEQVKQPALECVTDRQDRCDSSRTGAINTGSITLLDPEQQQYSDGL